LQRPIRLHECLLCNVFGLGRIVHVTHDQLQHLVLVSQDQQIERRALAALDPLDSLRSLSSTVIREPKPASA